MSLDAVAVNGFSYLITTVVGVAVSGTVTLTGTPSVKNKAGGNGICKNGFGISVSAIIDSGAGATIPDPGPYTATFSATALKVKADGSLVLRVNDKTGNISATPQIPGSPPVPYPVTFYVKITAANQSKVKAA